MASKSSKQRCRALEQCAVQFSLHSGTLKYVCKTEKLWHTELLVRLFAYAMYQKKYTMV